MVTRLPPSTYIAFSLVHSVLILLLRLRQICSHTSLIAESEGQHVINEDITEEAFANTNDLKRAISHEGPEYVARLKALRKEKALTLMKAEKNKVSLTLTIFYQSRE